MTTPEESPRKVELEIEVPGTPEEVWAAIATGPGISAWMHPTELEEHEGGRFAYDMGSGMRPAGRVTGWDPPRRFAQEDEWQPNEAEAPALLATEWLVEARSGGTCVVRMVMSGFGSAADWNEEIEGMSEGMRLALENLRQYLTHFPGRHGSWIRAFGRTPGSRDEGWSALGGELGIAADAAEGARVATGGEGVPALSGVVERVVDERWHRGVILRVDAPAPGIAHVLVYGDRGWATLQACLYGADGAAAVAAEEPAWTAWMAKRFPAQAATSRT